MLLKELILNSFYFGSCGVLDRTDFYHRFYYSEDMVVLTQVTFNSFYFGRMW